MPQQILSDSEIIELKPWLDEWVDRMEKPAYIDDDPVLFMHAFDDKLDRELAGFFAAGVGAAGCRHRQSARPVGANG